MKKCVICGREYKSGITGYNMCNKHYKQFKSLSIKTIKNKIEYLDNQQKQWFEDRELKVSDREIIFARDTLEKLLEDNYEKF